MPFVDNITPAIYGITRKIAMPIVKRKWDELIVPVLQNERAIYEYIFRVFAFGDFIKATDTAGFEIFLIVCKHEDITFKLNDIPFAVFCVYWELARNRDYWEEGFYAQIGRRLQFEEMKDRWKINNSKEIKWCKEKLERWLNEN